MKGVRPVPGLKSTLQGKHAYSTVHSAFVALQNSTVHNADAPAVHILREDDEPHPFLVKSN